MRKIIIFNHKMSLLYDELYNYIERTNNLETDNDIIICPSDIYLEAFVNNSDWLIGSQNLNYNTDYKHTGEISTDQLKSLGVEYSIIGHYERVRDFNENAVIINNKLIAALDANIFPILCFGENIDDDYHEAIPKILDKYLKDVENIEFIIFAMNLYLLLVLVHFLTEKELKKLLVLLMNIWKISIRKSLIYYMVVLLIVVILMI